MCRELDLGREWFDDDDENECKWSAMIISHQISTQLITSGRFWSDVLDSAFYHRHQKWYSLLQRLEESMTR